MPVTEAEPPLLSAPLSCWPPMVKLVTDEVTEEPAPVLCELSTANVGVPVVPTGLVTAPALSVPVDDVAFKALVATLAEALDLTRLLVTATVALPAAADVSTPKLPVNTEEVTEAEAANDCTLLITAEASSKLLAAKLRLLPVVLALALADTVLPLTASVPAPPTPEAPVLRPMVPAFMMAVVSPEALWALITAKSAPVTLDVPATEEDTASPRPNTLAPLTVKVLKASFLLATAEAVLSLRVRVEVVTPVA